MIIKTVDELRQRIGKFVVLSYNNKFDDNTIIMKLLTEVDKGWLRDFNACSRQVKQSQIFGYNIYGKFSAQMNPFMPFLGGKETYSNSFMYARDPTEKEIKKFMQNWRIYLYHIKIKDDFELPF